MKQDLRLCFWQCFLSSTMDRKTVGPCVFCQILIWLDFFLFHESSILLIFSRPISRWRKSQWGHSWDILEKDLSHFEATLPWPRGSRTLGISQILRLANMPESFTKNWGREKAKLGTSPQLSETETGKRGKMGKMGENGGREVPRFPQSRKWAESKISLRLRTYTPQA